MVNPPPDATGPIILVENSTDIVIRNLIVDGADLFADGCNGGDDRIAGIRYNDSSGMIRDNVVRRVRHTPGNGSEGCQEGLAIWITSSAAGSYEVGIRDNTVIEFQKGGITVNGSDINVAIQGNNMVFGEGGTPIIAQNGIQLSRGATGVIKRNDVGNVLFTGADWAATGILLFEVNGVKVQENVVTNSQLGVAIAGFGGAFGGPGIANDNIIQANTLTDNLFGISLQAFFGAGGEVNDNVIRNNEITATTPVFNGIDLFGCVPVSGFCSAGTHTVDNNLLRDNLVSGYDVGVELNVNANNNTFKKNDFTGNTTPVIDNGSGNTFID